MIRLGNHIQMNILKYIRCLEKGSLLLYNEFEGIFFMSGKKDATGVSWSTKNADGTIRQDNSKYFKDTSKYEENEHIWYDRNRGQTGYVARI